MAQQGEDNEDSMLFADTEDRTFLMVCRETTSISDWSFLASLIGVTDYERIAMDNSTVQEKQRAIIRAWLNSGKASWAVLIHALRDPLVGKATVAEQIACKYAKSLQQSGTKESMIQPSRNDEQKWKQPPSQIAEVVEGEGNQQWKKFCKGKLSFVAKEGSMFASWRHNFLGYSANFTICKYVDEDSNFFPVFVQDGRDVPKSMAVPGLQFGIVRGVVFFVLRDKKTNMYMERFDTDKLTEIGSVRGNISFSVTGNHYLFNCK